MYKPNLKNIHEKLAKLPPSNKGKNINNFFFKINKIFYINERMQQYFAPIYINFKQEYYRVVIEVWAFFKSNMAAMNT